jgi:AraC-like DNA-binding protein
VAVLLDTTLMTPAERCQAMTEFLDSHSIPMRFGFDRPLEHMETWAAAWNVGGLQVLKACGSAHHVIRTAREVSATPSALIAVTFFKAGVTTGVRGDEHYAARSGEMHLLDLTEPYVMSFPNGFDAFTIQLSHDELGLPESVIRRGVRSPQANPMYELVRDHIARLCASAPMISDHPAASALGAVTIDLVRTLIASGGEPPPAAADALNDSLPLRIERYILQHLGDPALSPRRIAAEHYISLRHLYYLWSGRGCTLAEWIMSERLIRAGWELASAPRGLETVASVARRWGFADTTHFSRRFKERYGVSPGEWRQAHQGTVSSRQGVSDAAVR